MNPDIIIPTCKTSAEISAIVCDIQGYSQGCNVIWTCLENSAAKNRNAGLCRATSDIIIMVDDDIMGFYPGWWEELVKPLENSDIVMVSARLTKADGKNAPMMFEGNTVGKLCDIPRCPTAAIAFRNDGTRFNEGFIGSGYEDDDFCAQLAEKYPVKRFVINNGVRLIHDNEMKNQHGKYYELNKRLFDSLWETSGPQSEIRKRKVRTEGIAEMAVPHDKFWGIPKIMHFVWIGPAMPDWVKRNIDEFKNLNKEFEVMIHDEKILDERFKKAWNKIDGQFELPRKSDLLRLSALEKHGGWYFDTDFWPMRSIEDICDNHNISGGFFATTADKGYRLIANGIIGTTTDSDILKRYVAAVIYRADMSNALSWDSYGPRAITDTINSCPGRPCIGSVEDFYPIPFEERDLAIDAYDRLVAGDNSIQVFGSNKPYTHHLHMVGRTGLKQKDPSKGL